MRVYFVSGILFAFCSTVALAVEDEAPNFNMDTKLSPEDLEELKILIANEMQRHNVSKLESVNYDILMNDYLDTFLGNVRAMIIKNGLDPSSLEDIMSIKVGLGKTDLTEGQLNDTSTIERYENATITYDTDSKQLIAEMVLRFEDLKFIYKYHTKITLISMTGHVHGNIKHIHIHVKLGFDFNQGLAFVDSIDFKHTGDIKITVSGNALIDWITNAMSLAITGILHNVILDIVKDIIASPINSVVNAINQSLHPSSFL